MKWIKLTDKNKPSSERKIAFMIDGVLFPDNIHFGMRSNDTGNYHSYGSIFFQSSVTHYFYVEKPTKPETSEANLNIADVISRFPESEFRTELYTDSSIYFKMILVHKQSGNSVNNDDFNINGQYKTRQILKLRLVAKLLLNGLQQAAIRNTPACI